MTSLVIVGAGGHGTDIHRIAKACGYNEIYFLDDRDMPGVIGRPSELGKLRVPYVLGVNDSRTREALDVSTAAATLVHPSAMVDGSVRLGAGVVVGAFSQLGPSVALGVHTHINGHCFVTRAELGDYVTVSPGVTICGDVTIGNRVQIGAGATVSNLVTIDDDVVVGAGAVVPPRTHLTAGTYVGVPARCLSG